VAEVREETADLLSRYPIVDRRPQEGGMGDRPVM
jgi:hypothetical protein